MEEQKPKRRRRKRRRVPIADVPVVEIISPKINVFGHRPRMKRLEDKSVVVGCTCGWTSRRRSKSDDFIRGFWNHAREVSNGEMLMNGEHDGD